MRRLATREEFLEACAIIFDTLLSARETGEAFDQHRLPPGCRSVGVYLEKHRQQVKLGTHGWTRCGKTRCVSAEAWAASIQNETTKATKYRAPPRLAVVPDVDDVLDEQLGIRTRRRSS